MAGSRSLLKLSWLAIFMLTMARFVTPLYFYFEAGSSKCFFEQLPADTIVVGHYYMEEWDDHQGQFDIPKDVGLGIVVKHIETDHALVSSRGNSDGRFAFSSHEAGRHQICFQTEFSGERLSNHHFPELRMHLDIIIGDSHRPNTESDKEHTQDLLSRARALNAKMRDLRKEQQYQREREMAFRNMSESTNARVVWCIILQMGVLFVCCIFQLSSLKVCAFHLTRRFSSRTKNSDRLLSTIKSYCTAIHLHTRLLQMSGAHEQECLSNVQVPLFQRYAWPMPTLH